MNKFIIAMLIAISTAACVTDQQHVPVYLTGAVNQDIVDSSYTWTELGFQFSTVDSQLPECLGLELDDCQITLKFVRKDNVTEEAAGALGYADVDKRIVTMDTLVYTIHSEWMPALSAHEMGHALLRAPIHSQDEKAVMYGYPTNTKLTQADRDIACEYIGIACE